MPNYQIKFTPAENFFFGGEKHSKNSEGDLETNYFVESNPYPQQTTLLGVTRYYLLLKNSEVFKDNKIQDKTKAAKIIGESSFDFGNVSGNYGKITSISPLYMNNGIENYFFAPLDFGACMDKNYMLSKEIEGVVKNYTAKNQDKFIQQRLISSTGKVSNLSDIITEVSQVGNEKTANQTEKENAFYKQNMKRLAKDWSFVIDAEIAEGANITDEIVFIPFGGEKCFFRMEIKENPAFVPTLPESYTRKCFAIICLSDCFLQNTALLDTCDFAVNKVVSFRNIQSKTAITTQYNGLSVHNNEQLQRSNRFNLLQRGSVLYFTNKEPFDTVRTAIESETRCKSIGYNAILTITNP